MELVKVNTEHGFKLGAKLNGEVVGTYNVPFDRSENISHGYISSKMPNRHVSRNLIYAAVNEIQHIVNKKGREITHQEYLVTDDSKKLSPIFIGLEYQKIRHPKFIVFSRTYKSGSPRN